MKKSIATFIFLLPCFLSLAQVRITPGDKALKTQLIREGTETMGYYLIKDATPYEVAHYTTEISKAGGVYTITSKLKFLDADMEWKETAVVDGNTLKTVSRRSERNNRVFNLQYADRIKGEYLTTATKQKAMLDLPVAGPYFDISTYPVVIAALPLASGYRATLPVVDPDAADRQKVYNVTITDVRSNVFVSDFTGQHAVWRVAVTEESTGNTYFYDIDKQSRRIYKITVFSGDKTIVLINKEDDFTELKTKLDKDATLRMVRNGKSVIQGEAFARDDRSGRDDRKLRIDVLNVNKKQFPPRGTKVILIPYTPYFKEWLELVKRQGKKGAKPVPLSDDAKECILVTDVYDDKGSFEFVNLSPGDYYIYISFNYQDYYSQREVTGYGDVYANGQYVGSEVYTSVIGHTQQGNANFDKVVTIRSNGEKVKVKLKRW